jgi:hypothetical protein
MKGLNAEVRAVKRLCPHLTPSYNHMTKKYKSKWSLIGIDKNKLKKIYNKNRIKAYSILKEKYKTEYSKIMKTIKAILI